MANYTEDIGHTLLPLDYFRRYLDVDPYFFWQMTYTGHQPEGYDKVYCHTRWLQEARRGPSRSDCIDAIIQAEEDIANIGEWFTWPAPKYIDAERNRLIKPNRFTYFNTPYTVMTEYWKVKSVGLQTWTLIEDDVELSYDGDDVECIVTVGSSVAEDEVVICYPDTTVPIRPISVSISGTTATIQLKRWLCGDPDLWDDGDSIDATDADNLLSAVDIYRVWIDQSDQITIIWEPTKSEVCSSDAALCAGNSIAACASDKDYDIGVVGWQVGTYDEDEEQWASTEWPVTRFPDLAEINYTSGYSLGGDRYMHRRMQPIVAKVAFGNLADYVYDAASKPEKIYHWMEDLSEPISGEIGTRNVPMTVLDNPFGTMRGQVAAWKALKKLIGR